MLKNPQRGCGRLKPGGLYLRSDISQHGHIPTWINFGCPWPYLEQHFSGYQFINGLAFDVLTGKDRSGSLSAQELERGVADYAFASGRVREWLAREELRTLLGVPPVRDFARLRPVYVPDLIMWIGDKYYPTPESFVDELKVHGLSKRIGLTTPPQVLPGITRLFLIHPRGAELDGRVVPGVIGYTFVMGVVYAKDPGVTVVPLFVENLARSGLLSIEDIEPVVADDQQRLPFDGDDGAEE